MKTYLLTIILVLVLGSLLVSFKIKNKSEPEKTTPDTPSIEEKIRILRTQSQGYLNYLQLMDTSSFSFPEEYRTVEFYLTQEES